MSAIRFYGINGVFVIKASKYKLMEHIFFDQMIRHAKQNCLEYLKCLNDQMLFGLITKTTVLRSVNLINK